MKLPNPSKYKFYQAQLLSSNGLNADVVMVATADQYKVYKQDLAMDTNHRLYVIIEGREYSPLYVQRENSEIYVVSLMHERLTDGLNRAVVKTEIPLFLDQLFSITGYVYDYKNK